MKLKSINYFFFLIFSSSQFCTVLIIFDLVMRQAGMKILCTLVNCDVWVQFWTAVNIGVMA